MCIQHTDHPALSEERGRTSGQSPFEGANLDANAQSRAVPAQRTTAFGQSCSFQVMFTACAVCGKDERRMQERIEREKTGRKRDCSLFRWFPSIVRARPYIPWCVRPFDPTHTCMQERREMGRRNFVFVPKPGSCVRDRERSVSRWSRGFFLPRNKSGKTGSSRRTTDLSLRQCVHCREASAHRRNGKLFRRRRNDRDPR